MTVKPHTPREYLDASMFFVLREMTDTKCVLSNRQAHCAKSGITVTVRRIALNRESPSTVRRNEL
jgi:hypothetical protein